jgi:UDP-N-acetylglucosamine--N-acetylmuramyl-(pentapeptide) pyrophosphoryl-undecaprenol N-acetylglucosamine transferase
VTRHLVIVAAGTGGHVIPGLAVAREMGRRGWTVTWLGTTTGMENRLVPPAGIALDRLAFTGLRGKGLIGNVAGLFRMLGAVASSLSLLRRRDPAAVLGMGGYVCFPAGWAAKLLGRPLLLMNADAALLLSNRALLCAARRVLFGFDGEAARRVGDKGVATGNPVRDDIESLAAPAARFAGRQGSLRLLVVGGSLGAKALNECLPEALALMTGEARPQVTHQTGEAAADAVRAAYAAHAVEATVRPFIDDMSMQLGLCDVIVCRAGAITVSELCAAGVPAVLVPLVVSTTSHQRDNAVWMAEHGAAIHLPQTELSPRRLADLIAGLTRDALLAMATRARALARPHAAARVADEIEGLVGA